MKLSKVTGSPRWYDDACGTALAMELVGERWSLLIVRELMFGPRRFGELRRGLTGVSANVLTQRLGGLERAGIVARRRLPPPVNAQVYELTRWGYEAEGAIMALGRWAVRSPDHDPSLPLSAASLMLSFRTMFDGARAEGLNKTVAFRIGGDGFVARLDGRGIAIVRGDPAGEVVFDGDPATIASAVYGGRPIADAEAAGVLRVEGNRALAERFVTLFPLPDKVGS